MKTARIHDYGIDPGIEEVQVPEIGPDEVLVRVKAVGLNPLDLLLSGGKRREFFPLSFPYTLGTDLAGTVERASPLAARWRQGDRVVARQDWDGTLLCDTRRGNPVLAVAPPGIPGVSDPVLVTECLFRSRLAEQSCSGCYPLKRGSPGS